MKSVIISIIIALIIRLMPDNQRKKIIRDLLNGLGCAIVGAAIVCLIMALILLKG